MTEYKTPMMKQYMSIKEKYPDCLLFFRMGDFYELFLNDAEIGSKILDITLTSRGKGKDGKIPMCGVPYHSIDSYLPKIINEGYKAAICEQLSDASESKEIVERDVVRIITPGTVVDEKMLDNKTNNYVLSLNIEKSKKGFVIAYADISTGIFIFRSFRNNPKLIHESVANEIKRINPNEIILNNELYSDYELIRNLKNTITSNITRIEKSNETEKKPKESIKSHFNIKSLEIFNIDESNESELLAINDLLNYLKYTQKSKIYHINKIQKENSQDYMYIDSNTINSLEIFHSNQIGNWKNKKNGLIDIIDKTITSMGGRLLKNWTLQPLINIKNINERLNAISEFKKNHEIREQFINLLSKISDMERILSKIGTGTANTRDLKGLANSINYSLEIINHLETEKISTDAIFMNKNELDQNITNVKKVLKIVDENIVDDPPVSIRDGGYIKPNINQELDDIRDSIKTSKKWISELESSEKSKTGISTLKVGFNSVFGYYIEISKSHIHNAPEEYIRKQTLVNAERYITSELKYHEEIVLSANEKTNKLEFNIFQKICEEILDFGESIQYMAILIAKVDCLNGFAELAIANNFTKPLIHKNYDVNLSEARHPVVEKTLETGDFTPNSTNLNQRKFVHLITGPNMSGKSTYIRQVALIQLLAQMGSFVPAEKAEISIVDGIYTRIGAGDALAQGLSTFMVEIIETGKILNNATKDSLIILDEIGRGTSTIDGLSIARAVIEHIHDKIKAKTLFATHFHELTSLSQRLKYLENYHVGIISIDDEKHSFKFSHKVELGGTDKSYGVEVAKLAGIPIEVINRANELLNKNSQSQLKLDI